MKLFKFLLLFLISVSSCTPQQRFTRLTERHPELIVHVDDTFIVSHTEYIPATHIDTAWVSSPQDTLILFDTITNSTVKIIRVFDTLTVSVDTPADTIYIEQLIPVSEIVAAPSCPPRWGLIAVGAIAMLIVLALLRRVIFN